MALNTGSQNTFLGSYSGHGLTSGTHNVAIGFCAQVASTTGNKQLSIGCNTSYWLRGDSSFNVCSQGSICDSKGNLRSIPANAKSSAYTLIASDAGKHISTTAAVTIPPSVFSVGDAITIYNDSGSDIALTRGSGVTMYNSADATNADRTLAGRGLATLMMVGTNHFVISGAGLS